MSDELFSGINNSLPEEELPIGHTQRFERKLNTLHRSVRNLRIVQRIALAASVAALFILTLLVSFNLKDLKNQKNALQNISIEFQETEQYLTSEIDEKMDILTANNTLDKDMLSDIRDIDKSCTEIKKELINNPYDDRLISAVIETYQTKLDLLNEIISKTSEKNI